MYGSYKSIWVGNDFFYTKGSFFDNLVKKLDSGWSSLKNWFSVPVPKIKFDPPPQGKNALVLTF